jgi:hypothetical protein
MLLFVHASRRVSEELDDAFRWDGGRRVLKPWREGLKAAGKGDDVAGARVDMLMVAVSEAAAAPHGTHVLYDS